MQRLVPSKVYMILLIASVLKPNFAIFEVLKYYTTGYVLSRLQHDLNSNISRVHQSFCLCREHTERQAEIGWTSLEF